MPMGANKRPHWHVAIIYALSNEAATRNVYSESATKASSCAAAGGGLICCGVLWNWVIRRRFVK